MSPRIGISESEARRRNDKVRVLRFPFVENDLAQIEHMPVGFIKAIVSRRGRVLGVSIVGRNAGELIPLWSLAVANRLNIRAIAEMVTPYPGLTRRLRRRIIEFLRKFG